MCGRYRLSRRKQIVAEHFDAIPGEEDWERPPPAMDYRERVLGFDTSEPHEQRRLCTARLETAFQCNLGLMKHSPALVTNYELVMAVVWKCAR